MASLRACAHLLLPKGRFSRASCILYSTVNKPGQIEFPDYGKTSVNIHEHKLKRPDKPPPRPPPARRWQGLDGLEDRTKGSLIPETLEQMETDEDFQLTAAKLRQLGQKQLTREERKKRQRALNNIGIPSFMQHVRKEKAIFELDSIEKILRKKEIQVLQLNIGIYCNQACNHCHVESSPKRKEMMSRETADRCLDILGRSPLIKTVDITGGAPELCSEFRHLVTGVRKQNREVIDRCNLTSLLEPGQEDTAEFLADNGVHVIASLPCYSAKNVNMQRGKGVFDKSIQSLLTLNNFGFGKADSGLQLDLVYNPLGAYLPPPQAELEAKYREELWDNFGIEFNKLYTITNMPIKRFADFLYRRNELEQYMELLVRNFNINTVETLMCLNLLSVGWDGAVYDCDLNQQLDMPIVQSKPNQTQEDQGSLKMQRKTATVWDIESTEDFHRSRIVVDNHCFGCTAGMGSS